MHWILFGYFSGFIWQGFLLSATDNLPGWLPGHEEFFFHTTDGTFWASSLIRDSGFIIVALSGGPLQHLTLFLQTTYGNNWLCLGVYFLFLSSLKVETLECSLTGRFSKLIAHPPPPVWPAKLKGKRRVWVLLAQASETATAVLRCGFLGNYPKKQSAWKCLDWHPVG